MAEPADLPGFAPAKVNLTLHVTGQRDDGLHLLDSLVVFADIGDRLSARLSEAAALRVIGPMAEGVPDDAGNLVLQAAAFFGASAAFTLEKRLPAAAGIGGGSSDAAAALRLLAALTGRPVPAGVAALGADLPVCLAAQSARMQGVGERLTPVALPPLPALLVNPGVAVPTGAVFSALPGKDNPAMPAVLPVFRDLRGVALWLAGQRNDLEAPARSHAPQIGAVLDRLAALPDVLLARMSGSGGTCFALFETLAQAQAAQAVLRRERADWWVVATMLAQG